MDDFITKLTPLLRATPQPYRNHPYWLGAIAAFDASVAQSDAGMVEASKHSTLRILRRIQQRLFGRTPNVTRLHPRWKDYNSPLAACKELAIGTSRLLIGASRATPLTDWLRTEAPHGISVSLFRLVRQRPGKIIEIGLFDIAFLELLDNEIANVDLILQHIAPLIRPGGQVVIAALNQNWFGEPRNFAKLFAASLGPLASLKLWPEDFYIAASSRLRWWINDTSIAAATKLYQYPTVFLPLHLAAVAALGPLMAIANFVSSWLPDRFTAERVASSVFIRLRVGSSDDVT